MKQLISLVIPCRNEALHIEEIVRDIPSVIGEIIIVNNNSTDDTPAVMQRLAKKDRRIVVIDEPRHKDGIGYGYACIAGMNAATGTYIVCMDGDGTYPMDSVEGLAVYADSNNLDLAIGNRYEKFKKPYSTKLKIGTWLLSVFSALLFGRRIKDIVSGMWVVRKSALPKLHLQEGGWNLSLEIKLKALMMRGRVGEYPITSANRFGESKQQYFKTGWQHAWWLVLYRAKTYPLWGYVALGLALVALIGCMYFYGGLFFVDTPSYGKIAEYYASFQLEKAINGYWSPLISWLLVPFVWLGIDFFVGMRVIVGVAIMGVLHGVIAVLQRRFISNGVRVSGVTLAVVLSSIGTIMVYWAARTATPDVLSGVLAAVAMYGTVLLLQNPTKRRGVTVGLLWALVFFAKSFGLFIAIAAVGVGALWTVVHEKIRKQHVSALIALVVMLGLLLGGWSLAVYAKYGELSLTTTSRNNFNLIGPTAQRHHQIDYQDAVLEPPYDDSVSAWDDPSDLPPKSWKLSENVEYYKAHVADELMKSLRYVVLLGPLVIGSIVVFLWRHRTLTSWMVLASLLAAIVGYSLLFIELRYLYIVAIPLLLFAIGVVNWQSKPIRVVAVVLALGSLVQIGYQMYEYQNTAAYLRGFRELQPQVAEDIPLGSRMAIQSIDTMSFCYYTQSSCVGMGFKLASSDESNDSKIATMKDAGVSYYLTRSPVENEKMTLVGQYYGKKRVCVQNFAIVSCGRAYILLYQY